MAADVEKNPLGSQGFKTRVPPFTFPTLVLLLSLFFSPPTRDSSSDPRSPKRFSNLVLLLPLFHFFEFVFSKEVFGSSTSFISSSSSSSMELES